MPEPVEKDPASTADEPQGATPEGVATPATPESDETDGAPQDSVRASQTDGAQQAPAQAEGGAHEGPAQASDDGAQADAEGPAPAAQEGAQDGLAEDLERRAQICVEAEQVAQAADFAHGPADLRHLLDEWNGVRRWHDPREDELWQRFNAARQAFYAARDAAREATRATKERLAEEAERLADSTQWNQTSERMRQMMDEWKAAGRTGQREVDDELWKRFNAARQAFAQRRHEHYEQLEAQREAAKAAKEALVEEARSVGAGGADWTAQQWRDASAKMSDLMDRWKKAGVAQRADNDRLWEEFRAARQPFFDAQRAHHEQLEAAYQQAAQAKEALVEKARALADGGDFGRQATEAAKQLDRDWKKLGFAGREANDRLWKQFNEEKERFWSERQIAGDARHAEWRQRTQDAIDRRTTRIENLRDQVARLQDRINNAYATDHVEEMQERLDERKETIQQLEGEVDDMRKRLAEDDARK